jgi:hypothetical protein
VEAAACRRTRTTVTVPLDDDRYPLTTDHILDAIGRGERRLLHIDRRHADEHREEALRGIPTRPGFDRDEYPPAATREGGRGRTSATCPPRTIAARAPRWAHSSVRTARARRSASRIF